MRWKKDKSGLGNALVERALKTLSAPKADGSIAFNDHVEFDFLSALLDSYLDQGGEYPELMKLDFVRSGILEVKRHNHPSARFVSLATQKEKDYLRAEVTDFYMGSFLSISPGSLPNNLSFRYRGDLIRLAARHPKKFERAEFFINAFGNVSSFPEFNYSAIYTKVQARNSREAGIRGIENLNFARGLINLHLNSGVHKIDFGSVMPFNEVLFGKYQLIFASDGKVDRSLAWYEPDFQKKAFPKKLRGKEQALQNFLRQNIASLRSNPLSEKLRLCLIFYSKALDEKDRHSSLVQLWSLLELLTDSVRLESKRTAWRASFMYRDRNDILEKVMYIAQIRNRYIHLSAESADVDTSHHLLRSYVERLLLFLIRNQLRFSSMAEAGAFFDMKNSAASLKEEIAKLQKVYRFVR